MEIDIYSKFKYIKYTILKILLLTPAPDIFSRGKKVLFSAHNLTLKHCTVQRFYFLLLRRNVI